MMTSGRTARTSEAKPATALVFMVMVLIPFLSSAAPLASDERDIGLDLGYYTLLLLHDADLRNVDVHNRH